MKCEVLEEGFTLIELLVVVAIIGVLAAIAAPQFHQYRLRAFNASAQSDLHSAINAEEAYFADWEAYQMCSDAGCADPALPGMVLTPKVNITCAQIGGGTAFECSTRHAMGTRTYYYNSQFGAFWDMP